MIPLFQRTYSWGPANWDTLWRDLMELCEEPNPRPHFIGSIVTMPSKSVPQGVAKFILIDGQQRLTTLLILLAALRDHARRQPGNLADKIEDVLLKNPHQEGPERYKLLPSKDDRPAFNAIMEAACPPSGQRVSEAYSHFGKKLRLATDLSLEDLYNAIIFAHRIPFRDVVQMEGGGSPLNHPSPALAPATGRHLLAVGRPSVRRAAVASSAASASRVVAWGYVRVSRGRHPHAQPQRRRLALPFRHPPTYTSRCTGGELVSTGQGELSCRVPWLIGWPRKKPVTKLCAETQYSLAA